MKSRELEALASQGTENENGQIEGAWLSNYWDLRAAGIRWQQAAFAAWHNAPKSTRQPRTMRELAELLGYASEQVFYKWKQQDWFEQHSVETMRESIFLDYLADVDRATIAAALTGTHQDRRLFYDELRRSIGSEDAEGAEFVVKVLRGVSVDDL